VERTHYSSDNAEGTVTHANRLRRAPIVLPLSCEALHKSPVWCPRATTRHRLETGNDAHRAPAARPGFSVHLGECAHNSSAVVAKSTDFLVESDEGGGLKNRCRERKKIAIAQVLVCSILSFRGEVAERLKAAVC
jgi:hypothetical protein